MKHQFDYKWTLPKLDLYENILLSALYEHNHFADNNFGVCCECGSHFSELIDIYTWHETPTEIWSEKIDPKIIEIIQNHSHEFQSLIEKIIGEINFEYNKLKSSE